MHADTDAERVLTNLGKAQACETGKRLRTLLVAEKIPPIKYFYYSTMARATETGALITQEFSDDGETLDPTVNQGVHMEVAPCSMIREGAVARPEPPHRNWLPDDESFAKEGIRVEAAFLS